MNRFAAPIAEQIWDMKYRLKDAAGKPLDVTLEDSWRRIARALAAGSDSPAASVKMVAGKTASIFRYSSTDAGRLAR